MLSRIGSFAAIVEQFGGTSQRIPRCYRPRWMIHISQAGAPNAAIAITTMIAMMILIIAELCRVFPDAV
jgi:hypothetical protein